MKTYLLKHGYDSKNGARPIERLIERVIKRPLAESLLSSDLRQSKYVNVFVEDGVVVRVYDANKTLFVEKNIQ